MENQNVNTNVEQMEQEPQVQGWRDVNITPDMPLSAIVQFLNVLNQRLCGIEDNLKIQTPDGQELSISEIYRQQAEAELAAQANEEQGE